MSDNDEDVDFPSSTEGFYDMVFGFLPGRRSDYIHVNKHGTLDPKEEARRFRKVKGLCDPEEEADRLHRELRLTNEDA